MTRRAYGTGSAGYHADGQSARAAARRIGHVRLRPLLASTSLAALLIGAGTPAAFAACTIAPTTNQTAVSNSGSINCIDITGRTVTNDVTNTPTGVITGTGNARPTSTGITINNSSIGGAVVNAGRIASGTTGNGISITTNATVSGGVSNSGTISADLSGIVVRTVPTFAGGISNTGTISAVGDGVFVTNVPNFSGGIGNAGTISAGFGISLVNDATVAGGISNSKTIIASVGGIFVDQVTIFTSGISNFGTLSAAVSTGIEVENGATFTGGIGNSGTITANLNGIAVNNITIFTGGISNSGTITAATQTGIVAANVVSFGGGISNSGTIGSLQKDGIQVTGVTNFAGGIGNAGMISAALTGIAVRGTPTFAGGISNTGTISAVGDGILVTSVTSFSGGIGNAGTISGGFGISLVNDATFAGGISNSKAITASVGGIFVNQVTTFTGGISNAGTIAAAVSTGIEVENGATFTGGIGNSGTISAILAGISVENVGTFAGGISNTGTIRGSSGIEVANSAPVSVFDSGVIVGTGGVAVDLSLNAPGNTFTLGPGYSIMGAVRGQGNDTFQLGGAGSGAFDLSTVGPAAQYQGFTSFNVVSGVWMVSNVFGQTQAWNVNGGTLAGTGTLPGVNVNSGGTLAPGTIGVPGTAMTIMGNLTFHPGAIYQVALNATTSTLANVGGAASLAGGVQGTLLPGVRANVTYDILHAGVVSGTFDGFSAPNLAGTLTYTPTDVLLNLTASLGNGGGLNQNQQSVANGINSFFNGGGTLPTSFANLFGLTGPSLGNALTQLSGENATGAATSTFQLGNDFFNLLTGIALGTGGAANVGTPGFAAQTDDALPPDLALAYDKVLRKAPAAAPSFEQRWTAWGAGFGGSAAYDGNAVIGSNNLTAADFGFAAGMDYHAAPDLRFGFALAGAGTNWSLAQGLGGGRSDAFQAAGYGVKHYGPLYVTAMATFGNSWFTTTRTAFGGDQLRATFAGQSYGARLEGGYRFAVLPAAGITPYAAVQMQWFHAPGYSETDLTGGGFGLTFNSQTANDTRSELGARVDDLTSLNGMPLLLRGRLAWAHDSVSNASLGAVFQALPGGAFTVNGAAVPTNSALVSASGQMFISGNWSVEARFDGELASTAHTYAGTGTLRYSW